MSDSATAGSGGFAFNGDERELRRLCAGGVVYSRLSLGVYSFWAYAANYRYLSSPPSFAGEPFDYNGNGGRLLTVTLACVAAELALLIMIVVPTANRGGAHEGVLMALMDLVLAISSTVQVHLYLGYQHSVSAWRGHCFRYLAPTSGSCLSWGGA